MKVAVLNNSGNVGKTTISKHLLAPRMDHCQVLFVETVNEGGDASNFTGKEFRQVLLQIGLLDSVVVDIGSSNIEAVFAQLRNMPEAVDDFDFFIVPTVSGPKQQRDTANTLNALIEIGVPASKIRLVFNMLEYGDKVEKLFPDLVAAAREMDISTDATIRTNEVYHLIGGCSLADSILDVPQLKQELVRTTDTDVKRKIVTAIGISRLATGARDELDETFRAMRLA